MGRSPANDARVLRPTTIDDRGRRAMLPALGVTWPTATGRATFPAVARAVAVRLPRLLLSPAGTLVVLLVALGAGVMVSSTDFGVWAVFFFIVAPASSIVILVTVVVAVWVMAFFRGRAEQLREEALSAGRCPSCGYEIWELPLENDGCVRCPECSAAWRRPDPPGAGRKVVVVSSQ